jgi:hypothetical protein
MILSLFKSSSSKISPVHNNSVERDGLKLRFKFPPPAAPAAPHVKRYVALLGVTQSI